MQEKVDNLLDRDKTGLLTIDSLLAKEKDIMKRGKFYQKPIYALIDLDNFKTYNTHLGYESADKKLI